jgi:hypothetical protein
VEFYQQQLEDTLWSDNKHCAHLEDVLHERFRFVRLHGEWFMIPLIHAIPIIRQTIGRYASIAAHHPTHYWRMRLTKRQFWYNFPANDRRPKIGIDWEKVR